MTITRRITVAAILLTVVFNAACASRVTARKTRNDWVEVSVELPETVNQNGALVGRVILRNPTDVVREFRGVHSIWSGGLRIVITTPSGTSREIPGREALNVEFNPFLVREIPPGGCIVVPIYILKFDDGFVFADSGPMDISVQIPRAQFRHDGTVQVEPLAVSDEYRAFFDEWIFAYVPYSCFVGDEHVARLDDFTGRERDEVARFVAWMYGGSVTSLMINGQSGDTDYGDRFTELFSLSFTHLDAMSPDETYWSLYEDQRTPKDRGRRMYLH